MAIFTVTITDSSQLAGVTAARNAYNNSLPPKMDKDGKELPITQRDGYLAKDQDYVQFVMDSASKSYANQYKT